MKRDAKKRNNFFIGFSVLFLYIGGFPVPQSLFSYYSSYYNNRINVLSDFTIQKTVYPLGGNDYMAHITVNKVGSNASTTLHLMICVTESNIPHSWGSGLSTVDHINRLMAPDAQGTLIDFGSGNSQTYNIPFTLDASWVYANLQFVVFVQDFSTREVLQGTMSPFSVVVGVNENLTYNYNLNVYPNPINKEAVIAFDLNETSNTIINIYDMMGKNVYSKNLGTLGKGANMINFDGSNLNSGMYVIKLIVNNQTITKKITID